MQKEFTKSDLKDGMVVEEQRGVMGVVLKDRILYEDGWDSLISWEEDLRSNSCDGFDIVKIYKIRIESIYELSDILDIENLELIWERDETKRMTSEEMRVKLEELTGEKIEIEPSREEVVGACYEYCKNYPVMSCKDCPLHEVKNCNFEQLTNEELKECYEKVIANEKKDAYVAEKSYQRVEWSALSAKKSRTSG